MWGQVSASEIASSSYAVLAFCRNRIAILLNGRVVTCSAKALLQEHKALLQEHVYILNAMDYRLPDFDLIGLSYVYVTDHISDDKLCLH